MSKTRAQKQDVVDALSERLRRARSLTFLSVSGYTMAEADALRAKGKPQDVEFRVTKKTLLKRAADAAGVPFDATTLEGSVLCVMGFSDEMAPSKLSMEFLKKKESMTVLGGFFSGAFVDAAAVKQLALTPGRQELLGMLVGSLSAPASGLVGVLSGTLRSFVQVLDAAQKSKASA